MIAGFTTRHDQVGFNHLEQTIAFTQNVGCDHYLHRKGSHRLLVVQCELGFYIRFVTREAGHSKICHTLQQQLGNRFRILGSIKHQRMPDLVAQLADQAPAHWRFVWIGDGPDRHLVENRANLELVGRLLQREALERLSRCDVALHAARWEGMPNALLEAMAIGMPCLVSDVVGTRDLVEHTEDGWLFNNRAPLSTNLQRLAALDRHRQGHGRIGAAARANILRSYTSTQVGKRWSTLEGTLLNVSRNRGHSGALTDA